MKRDSAEQERQPRRDGFDGPANTLGEEGGRVEPSQLSGPVASAAALVARNYREGVNARQVARAIGVDRSRLAAAFREQTGLTLHAYIVRVRLKAALTMIASGTKIEAVALLVGYRDKSSFYRQFRRAAGVTPKAYYSGSPARSSLPPGRLLPDAWRSPSGCHVTRTDDDPVS